MRFSTQNNWPTTREGVDVNACWEDGDFTHGLTLCGLPDAMRVATFYGDNAEANALQYCKWQNSLVIAARGGS
jgi:hypothetical protein